jgi:hypothetical protein
MFYIWAFLLPSPLVGIAVSPNSQKMECEQKHVQLPCDILKNVLYILCFCFPCWEWGCSVVWSVRQRITTTRAVFLRMVQDQSAKILAMPTCRFYPISTGWETMALGGQNPVLTKSPGHSSTQLSLRATAWYDLLPHHLSKFGSDFWLAQCGLCYWHLLRRDNCTEHPVR